MKFNSLLSSFEWLEALFLDDHFVVTTQNFLHIFQLYLENLFNKSQILGLFIAHGSAFVFTGVDKKSCEAITDCPTQRAETVGDPTYQRSFCTDGFCNCFEDMNYFPTDTTEYFDDASNSWTQECKLKTECEAWLNIC